MSTKEQQLQFAALANSLNTALQDPLDFTVDGLAWLQDKVCDVYNDEATTFSVLLAILYLLDGTWNKPEDPTTAHTQ